MSSAYWQQNMMMHKLPLFVFINEFCILATKHEDAQTASLCVLFPDQPP
jgi:hypothetical protein